MKILTTVIVWEDDSCENFVDHVCYTKKLPTLKKYLKSSDISHAPHHIYTLSKCPGNVYPGGFPSPQFS